MKKVLWFISVCAPLAALVATAQQSVPSGDADIADLQPVDTVIADVQHVDTTMAIQPPADGPKLDFGKISEHDFGKIPENSGKQYYEYNFINSGNQPLVITKTIVSCKCVDVEYPKKPVMPGEKGAIKVTYNPKKQKGVFYKAIQVYSNDPRNRLIIIAKGEVVE